MRRGRARGGEEGWRGKKTPGDGGRGEKIPAGIQGSQGN